VNTNFGTGNAFNNRANVSVSGTGNRILAGGNVAQAITGAAVHERYGRDFDLDNR